MTSPIFRGRFRDHVLVYIDSDVTDDCRLKDRPWIVRLNKFDCYQITLKSYLKMIKKVIRATPVCIIRDFDVFTRCKGVTKVALFRSGYCLDGCEFPYLQQCFQECTRNDPLFLQSCKLMQLKSYTYVFFGGDLTSLFDFILPKDASYFNLPYSPIIVRDLDLKGLNPKLVRGCKTLGEVLKKVPNPFQQVYLQRGLSCLTWR